MKRILTAIILAIALCVCIILPVSAAEGTPVYSAEEQFTARDLAQTADLNDAVAYTVSDGKDIHITKAGVYVLKPSDGNSFPVFEKKSTYTGEVGTAYLSFQNVTPPYPLPSSIYLVEGGPALKGDVNLDGKVDISDIVAVINQVAGTSSYKNADVNGDNKVDISDIVAIINIIAGN